jgi:hypothetical protein
MKFISILIASVALVAGQMM